MNDTFEIVYPRPIRDVSLGSKASTDYQILGLSSPAVRCLDVPTPFFSVELSIDNNTLKSRLTLDVENSIACVEVISQVVVIRVVVWPIVTSIRQLSTYPISNRSTNALMTSGILN